MNELETKAVAQEFAEIKASFSFVHNDIMTIVNKHNDLCDTVEDIRKAVIYAGVGCLMLGIGGYFTIKVVSAHEQEINELRKEVQKLKNGRS